jgi:hypothetical protein
MQAGFSTADFYSESVALYPSVRYHSPHNIPVYNHSAAPSVKACHKCKAKELRTMTR